MDNFAFTKVPPEQQAPASRQDQKSGPLMGRGWRRLKRVVGMILMLIGLSTTCLVALVCVVTGYGLWLMGDLPVTDGPGHDGQSAGSAIVVHAASESEGIPVEYRWLLAHSACPVESQALVLQGDRAYDRLTVDCPEGANREFWFDITEFYGH